MPSTISVFYFAFVILYYAETQKQATLQRERDMLNTKLCIDIRNSYQTEPIFHQSLPVSIEQGHGFGTKSMAHIVEKHGGVFKFSVKDGWFIFQATA